MSGGKGTGPKAKKDPKGGLWFGCLPEDRNRFYRGKFFLIISISL